MSESAEKWLSMNEIAQHLGISRDTVLTWIKDKKMPAHKIGRIWKFQASEVDAWIKNGNSAE
ncbi:MAG: helix-turn-helix domain-containing protein [Clostridiales Family XIII bacterium]|jgi:excisionase family DNA binding protein|nr:helix-turn-helix domain-containing protein [Clostridiales Family XIII bacterium]